MIVIDASAAIELVLNSKKGQIIDGIISNENLCAPHLIDVEVLHVFRRYALQKELTNERIGQALGDYFSLTIKRYNHFLLWKHMWSLHKDITAYDAAYVSLASILDCPLLTCDEKLKQTVKKHIECL